MKTGIFYLGVKVQTNCPEIIGFDLSEDKENITKVLTAQNIKATVESATMLEGKDLYHYGYIICPEKANQMTYREIMSLFPEAFCGLEEYGYTVPRLSSVISAGVGMVTKSFYACGENIKLKTLSMLSEAFHKQCGLSLKLIYIKRPDGKGEIISTSPLTKEGNPQDAWQNYLSKACKQVIPEAEKIFFQSWSSNLAWEAEFTGAGKDISPERKREYARYGKKRYSKK